MQAEAALSGMLHPSNHLPTISNPSSPALRANNIPASCNKSLTTSQHVHGIILDPDSTEDDSPRSEDQVPKQRARSPAVDVVGLHPLKKYPKGNSVKQYHNLSSMQGVVFYHALEVTDEYGTRHCFDLRDKTQGALVRVWLL